MIWIRSYGKTVAKQGAEHRSAESQITALTTDSPFLPQNTPYFSQVLAWLLPVFMPRKKGMRRIAKCIRLMPLKYSLAEWAFTDTPFRKIFGCFSLPH